MLDALARVENSDNDTKEQVYDCALAKIAWGLGKLGDRNAYKYLIEMLDDPQVKTENTFEPGESIRAAQAIADINGWVFEWHKDSVALIKHRLAGAK